MSLPRRAAIDAFVKAHAVLDKAAFFQALDGTAVLVRLDERGGRDEPAPWAFRGPDRILPVDIPSRNGTVFVGQAEQDAEPTAASTADASTRTGPGLVLTVPAARGRATVHVIPHQPVVSVGRERDCDVPIEERSVSRRHMEIRERSFGLHAVAMRRTNRVRINGRPMKEDGETPLFSGDIVELGDVSFLFLAADAFWECLPHIAGDG